MSVRGVPDDVEEARQLDADVARDVPADATSAEVAAYVKGWCAYRRRVVGPPYTRAEQELEFALVLARWAVRSAPPETRPAFEEHRARAERALQEHRAGLAKAWAERPLKPLLDEPGRAT